MIKNVFEEQSGEKEEYIDLLKKNFKDNQNVVDMALQSEKLIDMKFRPIIKKTDSGNVILKFFIDDKKKLIVINGLLSKEERILKSDYLDIMKWFRDLLKFLSKGYILYSMLNAQSLKIMKNFVEKNPPLSIKLMDNHGETSFEKKDEFKGRYNWVSAIVKNDDVIENNVNFNSIFRYIMESDKNIKNYVKNYKEIIKILNENLNHISDDATKYELFNEFDNTVFEFTKKNKKISEKELIENSFKNIFI